MRETAVTPEVGIGDDGVIVRDEELCKTPNFLTQRRWASGFC